MKYYAGADPDLHQTAIAWVSEDLSDFGHILLEIPTGLKGFVAVNEMARASISLPCTPELCFIEQMEVVSSVRRGVNPNDLLPLAAVGGIISHAMASMDPPILTQFVLPRQWKGSQPKRINQQRTWKTLNIPCILKGGSNPYCVPQFPGRPPEKPFSQWKHLSDAYGLALAALKQGRGW